VRAGKSLWRVRAGKSLWRVRAGKSLWRQRPKPNAAPQERASAGRRAAAGTEVSPAAGRGLWRVVDRQRPRR
ncbi:MAG: hypothetical protein AAFQ43_11315, partial [Bacteroidota bacterium]